MQNLKKYILPIFIGLIFVFFIIPLAIKWLFETESLFPCFDMGWRSIDVLLYFGSVLGGIGTIFLGIVTLKQSRERFSNTIDRESANTKRPFFIIDDVYFLTDRMLRWDRKQNGFKASFSKQERICIDIVNIGDGVANHLTYEPYGLGNIPREQRPSDCVEKSKHYMVHINLPINHEVKSINIIYENMIGYAYSQKIELQIEHAPQITGCYEDVDGEPSYDYDEYYEATVFSIHPQVPIGLGKYDEKTGTYIINNKT